MAVSNDIALLPIPNPGNDPNMRTTWENFKKIKTQAPWIAKHGVLQRFLIDSDFTIPDGWYIQSVAPIIDTGVTITVETGGLWFIDT